MSKHDMILIHESTNNVIKAGDIITCPATASGLAFVSAIRNLSQSLSDSFVGELELRWVDEQGQFIKGGDGLLLEPSFFPFTQLRPLGIRVHDPMPEKRVIRSKGELHRDTVASDCLHVGIELELTVPGQDHDDDACRDDYRDQLCNEGATSILSNHFGIDRPTARRLADYFDEDSWIDNMVDNHSCDYDDCPHRSGGEQLRSEIRRKLVGLTNNGSIKVVDDGSVRCEDDETVAEVCWNYFASKRTLKDNAKILSALEDMSASFDTDCGLHINLNNYLNVPKYQIETRQIEFLFNLVAPSRRRSDYCNHYGMTGADKYSMIYHQGDRLEFRFFSPTLDPHKLNAYVSIANFVYRRLAGHQRKMPRKLRKYLFDKMTKVNKLTSEVANWTLDQIDALPSAALLSHLPRAANAPGLTEDTAREERASEPVAFIA